MASSGEPPSRPTNAGVSSSRTIGQTRNARIATSIAVSTDVTIAVNLLLECHPLVPAGDVGGEPELADLGFEGDLCLRIAVDQEHASRIPPVARPLAGPEARQPLQEL